MDKHIEFIIEQKILDTIRKLEKNNMTGYYAKSKDEVVKIVKAILPVNATVSVGGSRTLFEIGVINLLRSGDYTFYDRYKNNISEDEIRDIYAKTFSADAFMCSSNAITENGELVNMDGTGNRVAAMIYGPKKVIIIAGYNKIVKNIDEASHRIRNWCAPINGKKKNKSTPCSSLGKCMDCSTDDRMCNNLTVIYKQRDKKRIHVILVNENLGY
jgi:L-lactate utilization protein LutB